MTANFATGLALGIWIPTFIMMYHLIERITDEDN